MGRTREIFFFAGTRVIWLNREMRACLPDESEFFSSEVFKTTSAPAPRQIKHKIKQTLQTSQNHPETGLRRARDVRVIDVALVAPSLGEPLIFPLIKRPRNYNLSSPDTQTTSSLESKKRNKMTHQN